MNTHTRRRFLNLCLALGGLSVGACNRSSPHGKSLSKARVIVAGGGYAGLNAAQTLKWLAPELHVTLIEQNPVYTRCPGSNLVIAGIDPGDKLVHPLRTQESRSFDAINGTITQIDAKTQNIFLADESRLFYDRLIVAPGIDFHWDRIEGYGESVSLSIPHAWKAGEQTFLLKQQLLAMPQGGTVIITVPDNPYRCPPGPYERASLIAHLLTRINPKAKIIIVDAKSRFSKQAAFSAAWRKLYPGMIEWVSSEHEGVIDHIDSSKRVVYTEFSSFSADVLNVIPPQKAGRLAELAGLTDATGWCPVNPISFESSLIPKIHIIGDAASVQPMPKSAFAAQSQARICGAAVVALLNDQAPAAPRLINHCYSFVNPLLAISVTGVYGYDTAHKTLGILSSGETGPDDNWELEAEYARDWYGLLNNETFGLPL